MMATSCRKYDIWIAVVLMLLLFAYICRLPFWGDFLPLGRAWIRCSIQCGLLILWAISIYKRILQSKARDYLLAVAVLFVFWLLVRTVKYTLLSGFDSAERYAWYLYYIPMLLAPVFSIFAALCIGKPETYVPSRRWKLLFIPAILGIGLVLINDVHQLAFIFPGGIPNSGDDYAHGLLYYFILCLIFGEAAVFLGILGRKCRLGGRGKRVVLPVLPILFLLVYCAFYVAAREIIETFAGDMTAIICGVYIAAFEACVYMGLFPVNTHYIELFHHSGMDVQITDDEYNLLLASEDSRKLSKEDMKQTENAPVMLAEHRRLLSAPIRGGRVLWSEDVSEVMDVISELEELEEDLADRHRVLQEEYLAHRKRQSLEEKNRLYNIMQNQTKDTVEKLSEMTLRLANTADESEISALTVQIAVITAYLKRRNNLIFIAEGNRRIPPSEMIYCFQESLHNLALCGGECEVAVYFDEPLPFDVVTSLYDAFEAAAERVMDSLKELYVTVSRQNGVPTLCLNIVCEGDLHPLSAYGFDVVREDEREWTLSYPGDKGGELK